MRDQQHSNTLSDVQYSEDHAASHDSPRHGVLNRALTHLIHLGIGVTFLLVAVGPAAAQSSVGDVYCGTGVETGITIIFGAIAGLGLPATGLYLVKSGLDYMRAGGDPERKQKAQEELVMAAVGFGVIVFALISPELIDNIGVQMGFGFSDCVKPF